MGRNQIDDSIIEELSNIPGFAGCSKRQLAEVDRLTDRIQLEAGQVVLREGDMGREAYLIVSGRAAVTRCGQLLSTLGPGDHFGEFAAIEMGRRTATLTALSPLTVLAFGPREYTALLADIPGFRDLLLRNLVKKLRMADDTIETMQVLRDDQPMAELVDSIMGGSR